MSATLPVFEKLATGIKGLDQISHGGLPRGRATLVAGTAGSAKTVFSAHYLAQGITQYGQAGVFVSFEETPPNLRRNMAGFGWDIPAWETERKWTFIDASRAIGEHASVSGDFDFGGLVARIKHAVQKTNATRLVLDFYWCGIHAI